MVKLLSQTAITGFVLFIHLKKMRLSHAKLFSSALHIRAVAGNRSLHKAVTGGLSGMFLQADLALKYLSHHL